MKPKIIFLIILLNIIHIKNISSQINIPVADNDLYINNNVKDIISSKNINSAQVWLYSIKNNIISNNKFLVTEITFNKQGLPEKVINFNEKQNISFFTVIKYKNDLLPFEEITFTSDTALIDGTFYEYDENKLLKRKIHYNNSGEIDHIGSYLRNDSIQIVITGRNNKTTLSHSLITSKDKGKELIKNIIKVDHSGDFINARHSNNKLTPPTKKYDCGKNDQGSSKEFIYKDNGVISKTITYDSHKKEIENSSYEYNEDGNLVRIIEHQDKNNTTNIYTIRYFTKN